jgi:hypothetical protein
MYNESNFTTTGINTVAVMKAYEVQTQAADVWQDPYFINVELFNAMFVLNN